MIKHHYSFIKIVFVLFLMVYTPYAFSQNKPSQCKKADSIALAAQAQDSAYIQEMSLKLQELTAQVQEMKLNEIILRGELSNKDKGDSIKKAIQKAQIDSLRLITKGAPLIVEDDTLFVLYARKGGIKPTERVKKAQENIINIGKRLTVKSDSVYTFESELFTDIMADDRVIISITDQDALWMNTSRDELVKQYVPIINQKISDLHAKYGLQQKIKNILLSLAVVAGLVFLIYLTNKLFRRLRIYTKKFARRRLKPISIKGSEILNIDRQESILVAAVKGIKYVVIIIQLILSLSILFSIFPETEKYAYLILSYIWDPTKKLLQSFIKFVPDLFQIIVICLIFKYILKGIKYIATEIAAERIKITGFYPDWAVPTYSILRFLLFSFMIIMIWPLLPNSSSPIFQGVSVFLGLIVSLGSTSVIANLMAGFVITYMRPFKIGDQIKLNDTVGRVIEKTPFVIRIQTSKKETITIPNSFILSSQTTNYSTSAKETGIVIHSDITVGYDVPLKQVEKLLIEAATKTQGVIKKPEPFVLVTSLPDFYCCYQINAYTKQDQVLPRIYSELHKNIINVFNEAGIEILSPHFYAKRDGNEIMMPEEYKHKTDKDSI